MPVVLASNNGSIGGGEVMLVHLARAMRELGHPVGVVGPAGPGDLVRWTSDEGFPTTALPGSTRRHYARSLRRWDHGRTGLLWCNGLLPAAATAGRPRRVVHLHRRPDRRQAAARRVAARGALAVVLPSVYLGGLVPHTDVLPNWTDDPGPVPRGCARGLGGDSDEVTVGFLGRLTLDKGIDVLAEAVRLLRAGGRRVRLVLGGEPRFDSWAERSRVSSALAPLGPAVVQLGWTDRADFFAQVDIAAFPSTWGEPFGLVAAEAMAARVPFVVSDAGGLPEVVGRDFPWVVRAGDPSALARTLTMVIDQDPDVRQLVVDSARQRWEAHFSPSAGRQRLAVLLQELLDEQSRRHA